MPSVGLVRDRMLSESRALCGSRRTAARPDRRGGSGARSPATSQAREEEQIMTRQAETFDIELADIPGTPLKISRVGGTGHWRVDVGRDR